MLLEMALKALATLNITESTMRNRKMQIDLAPFIPFALHAMSAEGQELAVTSGTRASQPLPDPEQPGERCPGRVEVGQGLTSGC